MYNAYYICIVKKQSGTLIRKAPHWKTFTKMVADADGSSEYFGGSPGTMGGVEDLLSYASSRSAESKKRLIRNIATDMKSILRIPNFNPDGPIDQVVDKLKRLIQKLKTKSIKGDAQSSICNALAKSINNRYGSSMINLDDTPSEICRKSKEVIQTLLTQLHGEFLAVAGDVSRSIKNLELLRRHLSAAHTKLINSINESDDESLKMEAGQVNVYYENINKEITRQLSILANILNTVVDPVTGNIVALLEESKEFEGFVDKIKEDLGSDEFGQKLSILLAGVNQVAQVAYSVDKALKKIGMSVKEYKDTEGVANLRGKVYDLLVKKGDKMRARDIQTFMQAAEILYRNDYAHDDIVKYLESKKGGYNGGVDDDYVPTRKKKSLSHRINQQKKYRKLIFKDCDKRRQL